MTIVITGMSGFLGSALFRHLTAQGHDVRGVGSLRLGDPFRPDLFCATDCVVHGAYDFAPDARARNIHGTLGWFEAAREQGVARQIFISSHSARADAPGVYGATKFELEKSFAERGATVVRPGLIAGPGGVFWKLAASLLGTRIAPLLRPDPSVLAIVGLGDFLTAMSELLVRPTGVWNLFHSRLLTGREFADAVWNSRGVRGRTILVPPAMALAAVAVAGNREWKDRVRTQLVNRNPVHQSDLRELVPHPQDPRDAILQAMKEMPA